MKNDMKYVEIPYVEKPVSRILYGTAIAPFNNGGNGDELLDGMLELGVTTLDLARVYGTSEEVVGKWMASRNCRDKVVLLSKCGHPTPQGEKRVNAGEMRKDLETSLSLLQTDHIDIYLLHRDDPEIPVGEILETFNAMHEEGRIGAFGGSNWTHERITEANAYAKSHGLIPFTVSSPNFGLAEQIADPWGGGCVTITGKTNADARAWYLENHMPIFAYSSLARGLFSGRMKSTEADRADQFLDEPGMKGYGCPDNYRRLARCEELAEKKQATVAQIAMAYILSQKLNTFAVVSTTKLSRMEENIQALHIRLTEEELSYLNLEI